MRTKLAVSLVVPLGVAAAGAAAFAQDAAPQPRPETPPGESKKSDLEKAVEAAPAADEGEIVVTATRTSRDPFELPQAVSVFGRDDVETVGGFVAFRAPSRRHPAIWYDERTGTTTDLIIRGFAGFNLLTLVDGNPFSTLWGEGGFGADDLYGKIDAETVERIEILRGPGSVLYGSNALGAVVNVITRSAPLDFTEEGWEFGGRVKVGVATNGRGDGGEPAGIRTELHGAGPRLRFLLGGSAREFDNLNGGGDLGELDPSDGRERNWDFSGEWLFEEGRTLRLTLQDVHRDHIKRYYRPYQDNENDREALALLYRDTKGNDLWDQLEVRLARQEKRDGRRFYTSDYVLDRKGYALTETTSGGVQATRALGGGHVLTAGLSVELDEADSPDDEQFTYYFPGPKRRDAPLSDWWDTGVYVQDEWRVDERWSLVGAARYDRLTLKTDVDDAYQPPLGNPEDDEFEDSVGAFTGGLGAVYRATPELHLVGNWGRGFRQNAPNFGLRQLGDGVLIPNQLLDPTTSDNFELGVKGRYEGARFECFVYESFIDNWQGDLRSVASYNGRAYLDVNENGVRDANESFVEQVEGGKAKVRGIEMTASLNPHALGWEEIPANWSVWGGFARNIGRVDGTEEHPEEEPLRHVQPTRGLLGVCWDDVDCPSRGFYVELVADIVNRFHDIPSDRRESDLAWREDAQDGGSSFLRPYVGTPGYTTFSLYAGINVTENATLRIGVENLTDKKYRAAHSRMDAPGISATASLEIRF